VGGKELPGYLLPMNLLPRYPVSHGSPSSLNPTAFQLNKYISWKLAKVMACIMHKLWLYADTYDAKITTTLTVEYDYLVLW